MSIKFGETAGGWHSCDIKGGFVLGCERKSEKNDLSSSKMLPSP